MMGEEKAVRPPSLVLARFQLSNPEFVKQTALARIWKVRRLDGGPAALKLYDRADMGNERPGFEFLRTVSGQGVAQIFEVSENAAVMEWLHGPSLGDLTRANKDQEAAAHLVAVANTIHGRAAAEYRPYPILSNWFYELFEMSVPDELSKHRKDIEAAKALARELLDSQSDICALHGDLHHDNVQLGAHGYAAFDAKGVVGERTYELANAFRNPKGASDLVKSPDRARFLRDLWAREFDVPLRRLMQWAAVKVALSIAWRCGEALQDDTELELLSLFLGLAEED